MDADRRYRPRKDTPPKVRQLLTQAAGIAARIRAAVVLYYSPSTAGGGNQYASDSGDNYVLRATRYDMTILHDAMLQAEDESREMRCRISEWIDAVGAPTNAKPGSAAKVEAMRARASIGKAVFCDKDRKR